MSAVVSRQQQQQQQQQQLQQLAYNSSLTLECGNNSIAALSSPGQLLLQSQRRGTAAFPSWPSGSPTISPWLSPPPPPPPSPAPSPRGAPPATAKTRTIGATGAAAPRPQGGDAADAGGFGLEEGGGHCGSPPPRSPRPQRRRRPTKVPDLVKANTVTVIREDMPLSRAAAAAATGAPPDLSDLSSVLQHQKAPGRRKLKEEEEQDDASILFEQFSSFLRNPFLSLFSLPGAEASFPPSSPYSPAGDGDGPYGGQAGPRPPWKSPPPPPRQPPAPPQSPPIRHWWAVWHHKRSASASASPAYHPTNPHRGVLNPKLPYVPPPPVRSGGGGGGGGSREHSPPPPKSPPQQPPQPQQCLRYLSHLLPSESPLHLHNGPAWVRRVCSKEDLDSRVKELLRENPCPQHRVCQVRMILEGHLKSFFFLPAKYKKRTCHRIFRQNVGATDVFVYPIIFHW